MHRTLTTQSVETMIAPSGERCLTPGPVDLFVCTGKDCRRARGFDAIVEIGVDGDAIDVPCQSICHGPVVGVRVGDEPVRWFERVRGDKARRSLTKTVRRGRPTKRLTRLEVRKRRGAVKGLRRARPLRR